MPQDRFEEFQLLGAAAAPPSARLTPAEVGAEPVLGAHVDDHLLAVLLPDETDVALGLPGRKAARRDLQQPYVLYRWTAAG
ncbi:hypothetical protein ACWD04_15535 [Streptomyces sp. NPDC002911]